MVSYIMGGMQASIMRQIFEPKSFDDVDVDDSIWWIRSDYGCLRKSSNGKLQIRRLWRRHADFMIIAYLALGSNLGNKSKNLKQAIALIAERIGNLSAISSEYETEPWGFESKNTFLNQVVGVETNLTPEELLEETQTIEKKMGRTTKTTHSYSDRIIDVDILFYGNAVMKSEALELPHPFFHQRKFVLDPLNEIAPDFIDPRSGKKIREIAEES